MNDEIVNGGEEEEEIKTIEFLTTLSEFAEDFRYLLDYPILVVEADIKSFVVMSRKDFDKLFKSIVG